MTTRKRRRKLMMLDSVADTVARACPVCRAPAEMATKIALAHADEPEAAPQLPQPGDVTVCGPCGTLLVFTRRSFRLGTDADLQKLAPRLRGFIAALMRMPMRGRIGRA